MYFINGFTAGGAENGLLTLLDEGFFTPYTLKVVAIHKGDSHMAEKISRHLEPQQLNIFSPNKRMSGKAFIKSFSMLEAEIRLFKPSIIMLSLSQANIVGRWVALKFPQLRVVAFEHTTRYPKLLYYPILYALSFRVAGLMADNEITLDTMRKWYLPRLKPRQHIVQPLHVVDKASLKKQFVLSKPAKVLMVGRLDVRKNYPSAILAIDMLRRKGQNVALDIIGAGKQARYLKRFIRKLGLTEHVKLLGFDDKWHKVAHNYDIFLQASTNEGQCIGVIEAMSLGMPIVSTNIGGMQYYGHHDKNMLKAATPTPGALADMLTYMLEDTALRRRLSVQAGADSLAFFGRKAFQNTLLKSQQQLSIIAQS